MHVCVYFVCVCVRVLCVCVCVYLVWFFFLRVCVPLFGDSPNDLHCSLDNDPLYNLKYDAVVKEIRRQADPEQRLVGVTEEKGTGRRGTACVERNDREEMLFFPRLTAACLLLPCPNFAPTPFAPAVLSSCSLFCSLPGGNNGRLKFVGLAASNQPLDWITAFLNPSNHEPGIPLDYVSFHFYASSTSRTDPATFTNFFRLGLWCVRLCVCASALRQFTMLAAACDCREADAFLANLKTIAQIRASLSPSTKLSCDETGVILPGGAITGHGSGHEAAAAGRKREEVCVLARQRQTDKNT